MEKSSKSCRTTVGREESTSLAELKQYFDHCNFPYIIEFILASLNLFTTNAILELSEISLNIIQLYQLF